jgi:hypothetical protein
MESLCGVIFKLLVMREFSDQSEGMINIIEELLGL